MKTVLAIVLGVVVLAVMAVVVSTRSPQETAKTAPPAKEVAAIIPPQSQSLVVRTTQVSRQGIGKTFKIGGYVEARESIRLNAQGPGRVVFIAGREGAAMTEGQVVVGLDEDQIMAEYRSAWSALAGQMSATQNAQVQLDQKLWGPAQSSMGGPGFDAYERAASPMYNAANSFMPFFGGSRTVPQTTQQYSPAAMTQVRTEYERQQAALVAAQANVDALEARLRDRRSIAPFNSVITGKFVNIGDVVQPGQPLVDLADLEHLELKINVPVRLIDVVQVDNVIPIQLDTGGIVEGAVVQVFPVADSSQHTVAVRIALMANSGISPGMYASAILPETQAGPEERTSLSVLTSAIIYRGTLPSVFILKENGVVELRMVRIGESTGDRTAVLSGLEGGERLVVAPPPTLRSGDTVQVKS